MTTSTKVWVSAKHLKAGDVLLHGFDSRISSVASVGFGTQIVITLESGARVPGFAPLSRLLVVRA